MTLLNAEEILPLPGRPANSINSPAGHGSIQEEDIQRIYLSDVVDVLAALLRDGVDVHRCGAARALGEIKSDQATEVLLEALLDEDEDVRTDAAEALAVIGDQRASKQLLEKVKVPDLEESAVYKLRKHVEQVDDVSEEDEDVGDEFENLYKGEISKSGTPILPSKRARKIPERIQVSKEDLDELKGAIEPAPEDKVTESEDTELSLENLKEEEAQKNTDIKEDTEATNS